LRGNERQKSEKTFFPGAVSGQTIHSPGRSSFKQDSLIFVCCIDFPALHDEIDHPIVTSGRVAGFEGAACAAKKR
jgi:hypothetical protein